VIPEAALHESTGKDFHIGRGGAGNELHDHPKGEHGLKGLGEKLKAKVLDKK
jgi:Protein of unknown function (DUF3602)